MTDVFAQFKVAKQGGYEQHITPSAALGTQRVFKAAGTGRPHYSTWMIFAANAARDKDPAIRKRDDYK